jgi:hypothetical protein
VPRKDDGNDPKGKPGSVSDEAPAHHFRYLRHPDAVCLPYVINLLLSLCASSLLPRPTGRSNLRSMAGMIGCNETSKKFLLMLTSMLAYAGPGRDEMLSAIKLWGSMKAEAAWESG